MNEEDEAFNEIERQAKQRKESVRAAVEKPQRTWVGLTDDAVLADKTLRYHFGMNGGAGPLSEKGKAIIGAVTAMLKERNA